MIRVNLLKPGQKDIRETTLAPAPGELEKPKNRAGLIFLVAIAAVIVVYFIQDKNMKKEQRLLDTVMEEKRNLQDVAQLLVQVEEQKALLEQKIDLINSLKSNQHIAVNIMDELSRNIPDWVWLVEASYDRNTVRIKGRALSNTLIADYILNLENSPVFTSVDLISSTQRQSGADEYLDFDLTAIYVQQGEQQ